MDYKTIITALSRRQFLTATLSATAILAADATGVTTLLHAVDSPPESSPLNPFPLPYGDETLSPYISANTLEFHYGKHYQSYMNKTNALIQNTPFAKDSLEEIINKTTGIPDHTPIFNNAAQAWNHGFYWQSMKPNGGGGPGGNLAKKLDTDFGSFEKFKKAFSTPRQPSSEAAGPGW